MHDGTLDAVARRLRRAAFGVRQQLAHGLFTACCRELIRPKLLRSRPTGSSGDETCEIHVLTSESDWLNLLWALKSFYHYSGASYALAIHDDGSLGGEAISALRSHFPQACLILRRDADEAVDAFLVNYPRCREFRRRNLLAPKVLDFAFFLNSERLLLLDSDILFFSRPDALLARIEDPSYRRNSVNADVASAYTVDAEAARIHAGVPLIERFNSGLGLIHKASLRFEWFEEFLGIPGLADGKPWRVEQTLLALASSRFGVELLPEEYDLRLTGGRGDRPMRHYVGAIRHLMYREGIWALTRSGFLRALRNPSG